MGAFIMYTNDEVQRFQAVDHILGSPWALKPILWQPNKNNRVLQLLCRFMVLEDAESIFNTSFIMIKKIQTSILGFLSNQWTIKPVPKQTSYQAFSIHVYIIVFFNDSVQF